MEDATDIEPSKMQSAEIETFASSRRGLGGKTETELDVAKASVPGLESASVAEAR